MKISKMNMTGQLSERWAERRVGTSYVIAATGVVIASKACFSKECALAGEVEAAQSLADLRAIDVHGVW